MLSRFVLVKLGRALLTMWLVVTFAFVILRATGDPIETMLGDQADPVVVEHYRKVYGLDRPITSSTRATSSASRAETSAFRLPTSGRWWKSLRKRCRRPSSSRSLRFWSRSSSACRSASSPRSIATRRSTASS
jgi:hypothetical protein